VYKAILYGVDSDCLKDASQASQATMTSVAFFEVVINGSDKASKLTVWRKKGPIRKLYNTVIHIKENTVRRLLFQSKQHNAALASEDEDSEVVRMYRVVTNRGIR
jgi:hypothetical protein